MGLDAEFTVILREIVQFLECLREVELSSALETIRKNLLVRSKTTLSVFATTDGITSPTEPYLHMNASSKGLLPCQIEETNELDTQEYVDAEETAKTEAQRKRPASEVHPDYYETFQSVNAEDKKKKEQEKLQENALIEIYFGLSASQATNKCIKSGPLYRKQGKKLFLFEQYRFSWVALVGTHLLIYEGERDSKPYIVKGIRGYSGRPAPNAVARDQRRSEAAFEIFKPGNKTLQFIARTSKDMEQWVAKICQIGFYGRTALDHGSNSKEDLSTGIIIGTEEINSKERPAESKSQSTFATANEIKTAEPDQEKKIVTADRKTPPPLPPHIPITLSRRLPSLPNSRVISSYETMDDEDDDIYHRIEDFGNHKCYQNLMTSNQHEKSKKVDAYDDCHAILKKEKKNVNFILKEESASSTIQNESRISFDKTYDDIASASVIREKNQVIRSEDVNDIRDTSVPTPVLSNDDTETSVNALSPGNKVKDKEEEVLKKSPNKKSFLDRMRNKMESPQKKEKLIAARRETLTPSRTVETEEMQTYDDVSDLLIAKGTCVPEEMSEYNCPPTPRPVFNKPPTISLPAEEAIYDDIRGCHLKKDQPQLKQLKQINAHNFENQISDDDEHYKSPRSETWQHAVSPQMEELYDDVDILANFTARQRKISDEIKDQDAVKPSSSSDKKTWNKFVTNRKTRSNDSTVFGSNKRISTEIAAPDGFEEQPNTNRKNTFQKLINKMENSLGKGSPRAAPTTSMNKPYGLNTSS